MKESTDHLLIVSVFLWSKRKYLLVIDKADTAVLLWRAKANIFKQVLSSSVFPNGAETFS